MALNDSNFEVREIAVTCLGKVARVNPGCTLPHMRNVMLELLASLESGQKSDCSDSARLLTFLIPSCKAVVIPFAPQILSTIVPHLTDRNKRVSANCLKILGLLSAEGGEAAAMALQTDIFPTIIDALHDRLEHQTPKIVNPNFEPCHFFVFSASAQKINYVKG